MDQRWPPGWYPDPIRPGQVSYWNGAAWVPAPGWYEDPNEPGTWMRWTGREWRGVRRQAPARLRRAIVVLDGLAALALLVGFLQLAASPFGTGDNQAFCDAVDPWASMPNLWPAWLLLLAIAWVLLVCWLAAARRDLLAMVSALGCVWIAAVTFPPWIVITNGLNCGL